MTCFLHKVPSLNDITLEIRALTYKFGGGGTNIQSTAQRVEYMADF